MQESRSFIRSFVRFFAGMGPAYSGQQALRPLNRSNAPAHGEEGS